MTFTIQWLELSLLEFTDLVTFFIQKNNLRVPANPSRALSVLHLMISNLLIWGWHLYLRKMDQKVI